MCQIPFSLKITVLINPARFPLVFGFVVEHTVAVTLKIGVVYLLFKIFKDTFILHGFGKKAGTVAATHFKSLFYSLYDFLVFV